MVQPNLEQLQNLERALQPTDLAQRVRAYVLPARWGEFGLADAEADEGRRLTLLPQQRAEQIALQLGREVATNPSALDELLPSVFCGQTGQAWAFGQGLAEGADSLVEMWETLVAGLTRPSDREQNVHVLRGFLNKSQVLDTEITDKILDSVATYPGLGIWFVPLQTSVSIGERGGQRIELALQTALAPIWTYGYLEFGGISATIPGYLLSRIILTLASTEGGFGVAVEILAARLFLHWTDQSTIDDDLIACGNTLLRQVDLGDQDSHFDSRQLDYDIALILQVCTDAAEMAETIALLCEKLKQASRKYRTPRHDYPRLVESLLRQHPQIVLNEILGDVTIDPRLFFVDDVGLHEDDLLTILPSEVLLAWAKADPAYRIPRLAAAIVPFNSSSEVGEDLHWKPLALEILAQAPDRIAVLNVFSSHFYPMSWSGSRANAIMQRYCLPKALSSYDDQTVVAWARAQCEALERMAEQERRTDRNRDERFE